MKQILFNDEIVIICRDIIVLITIIGEMVLFLTLVTIRANISEQFLNWMLARRDCNLICGILWSDYISCRLFGWNYCRYFSPEFSKVSLVRAIGKVLLMKFSKKTTIKVMKKGLCL